MKESINLTVACSIKGKGGIASVLNTLDQTGFFTSTRTILVASHQCGRFGKFSLMINFSLALFRILIFLLCYKVNIVHLHMASRGSYTRKSIITKLVKRFGVKVIIHLHGGEFRQFYSDECSPIKQYKIRTTFDLADRIIVLSTQWEAWVRTIVAEPEKIVVVYNAVSELTLPSKKSDTDIVLFLGRLGRRKGVEDLIHAFSIVCNRYSNAELHLGGDGDFKYYEQLIQRLGLAEKIKMLGWVSGEEKNQCMADAAIYCLPSYNEGFPMGVLEAMSSGIAVVASKAGGIPDAITDQKEGVLIDAGDVDSLARVLSDLLSDSALRERYQRAALIKYKNNFSPEIVNQKLLLIYSGLSE